ncbi:MAG: hypothetical protein AAF658_19380, partial [Myxococcota bacterium]
MHTPTIRAQQTHSPIPKLVAKALHQQNFIRRNDARMLQRELPLDGYAATNLAAFVHDQLEHAGVVPTDEVLLVERFRDELGDWRMCLLSPYGGRVHGPLA